MARESRGRGRSAGHRQADRAYLHPFHEPWPSMPLVFGRVFKPQRAKAVQIWLDQPRIRCRTGLGGGGIRKSHCLKTPLARKMNVGPTAEPRRALISPGRLPKTPPALMNPAQRGQESRSAWEGIALVSPVNEPPGEAGQDSDPVTLLPQPFPPPIPACDDCGHERRDDGGDTHRRWRHPKSNGRNIPSRRLRGYAEVARAGSAPAGSRGETAAAPHANPKQDLRITRPGTLGANNARLKQRSFRRSEAPG